MRTILQGVAALVALGVASTAQAFCGFYVSDGNSKLFNNATQVVMMRDGTRTILSMQNNYQGPPQNFALVIPVPVVLQKENVKTLTKDVFDRLDTFDAPRLVEYWEQDPCYEPPKWDGRVYDAAPMPTAPPQQAGGAPNLGVKIEAQFTVGEYEIVVLSAEDSTGLDTWLRQNKYNIPEGAAPVLKPYVERGMKFFVAKVDTTKVKFDDQENAMLSPLRFYYDSETFELPVRLGLLNSAGDQDLIVHILGKKRYVSANYPNATIPTNLNVADEVNGSFASFYAALFDATLAKNKAAKQAPVITEYAWDIPAANNNSGGLAACDPCPPVLITAADLLTLGADVIPSTTRSQQPVYQPYGMPIPPPSTDPANPIPAPETIEQINTPPLVLTRLHARYNKESLGEDLVFQEAEPIVGGREFVTNGDQLEEGARASTTNNFQGRYAIRHPWTGPINCSSPKRGVWGGPPSGVTSNGLQAAKGLAFTSRSANLPSLLRQDVPELGITAKTTLVLPTKSDNYRYYWLAGILSLLAMLVGSRVFSAKK